MFKTLTAALVAASVLIAPIAATAQAAEAATKAPTAATKVVTIKAHKRHVARHHRKHIKVVKHVRGHKMIAVKKVRHGGKFVKIHRHAAVKALKTRTN